MEPGKKKEQEERSWVWNGANGIMEKAEGCRAAASTFESSAFPSAGSAVPGGQSPPPAAGTGKPPDQGAVIDQVAGELPSATLTATPQSFFCVSAVSARRPTGEQGSSRAEGMSQEGPQPWSQGIGTQGQS